LWITANFEWIDGAERNILDGQCFHSFCPLYSLLTERNNPLHRIQLQKPDTISKNKTGVKPEVIEENQ